MRGRLLFIGLVGVVAALTFGGGASAGPDDNSAPTIMAEPSGLCDMGFCSPRYAVVSLPEPEPRPLPPGTPPIAINPRLTRGETANSAHSTAPLSTGDARATTFGRNSGGQILVSGGAGSRTVRNPAAAVRRELVATMQELGL